MIDVVVEVLSGGVAIAAVQRHLRGIDDADVALPGIDDPDGPRADAVLAAERIGVELGMPAVLEAELSTALS